MHAVFGFDRVIFVVLDDFFSTVLRFLIDLNAPPTTTKTIRLLVRQLHSPSFIVSIQLYELFNSSVLKRVFCFLLIVNLNKKIIIDGSSSNHIQLINALVP